MAKIEQAIDRRTFNGKRNYAIILLASRLGLRISDISALTFSNIDWDKNLISFEQYKTKRKITLPLLADVGEAIIDYILYARPKTVGLVNIFITSQKPYRSLTASFVSSVIQNTVRKSGVLYEGRHTGGHCLRHSNFDKHVINLYQTKNGHERLAPINTSMEVVLRQYISFRNRLPIPDVSAPWNYLFVSLRGTQIKKNAVDYHFKKILEDAEVIDIYNGKLPRIHDLRHTACVHAMHKILIQGKDLYCHLPILAAFMGHIKVNDTEYYLRLVRQQYPDLIKQQVSVVESITEIVNRALIIKSEDYV